MIQRFSAITSTVRAAKSIAPTNERAARVNGHLDESEIIFFSMSQSESVRSLQASTMATREIRVGKGKTRHQWAPPHLGRQEGVQVRTTPAPYACVRTYSHRAADREGRTL